MSAGSFIKEPREAGFELESEDTEGLDTRQVAARVRDCLTGELLFCKRVQVPTFPDEQTINEQTTPSLIVCCHLSSCEMRPRCALGMASAHTRHSKK
ncbi:hypothetical protein JTE90_017134 [Oedothorax gibbosus]|uniref:Uncharacterized protein n=1 Tax=Oedothorax gibbosus TaxID=931172 RepID=A0AAV6UEC1_9ARAC|nr:hypothetical protein JTE90_017134 [Oedothorax gibbosus]